jgi:hypothetical protein
MRRAVLHKAAALSAAALSAAALTGFTAGAAAASDRLDDASLKAAMVYNFARFAAWPPSRFATPDAPVVLCVNPSAALLPALQRLEGEPVGSRKLHVKAASSPGPDCNLVFVDADRASPQQVAALQRQGALTVGEGADFISSGAIGLVSIGRQIRFEINNAAAREAQVNLSSQLLRLAIVVRQ